MEGNSCVTAYHLPLSDATPSPSHPAELSSTLHTTTATTSYVVDPPCLPVATHTEELSGARRRSRAGDSGGRRDDGKGLGLDARHPIKRHEYSGKHVCCEELRLRGQTSCSEFPRHSPLCCGLWQWC